MTMAEEKEIALSALQIDVMRVLWSRGETSVTDVAAAIADQRGLKHTTVATLLLRLEKRGVVSQRREGRQLIYSATIKESQVRRSMVAEMIANLFGGDSRELVAHLLRESEIEPSDLERVRKRLQKESRHDS
jgi:BlaI family transcriptional regulator, penicillinase repressor